MTAKDDTRVADRPADATLSEPREVGRGFMVYERYDIALTEDGKAIAQQRDVLRASRVAAVLPVDLVRDAIVLIHQFRLPAHLVTGKGDMVEIVAGRIEEGEDGHAAALRECAEEIGVAPTHVAELYSLLPTPGFTDEWVTFYLGAVDSSAVPERGGLAGETEHTKPFVVSIDAALAALDCNAIFNGLLISALQWLALHRAELPAILGRATRVEDGLKTPKTSP